MSILLEYFDSVPAYPKPPIQKQPSWGVCKKGVLRNFAKFAVKHLCQSLFFNKVAGLRSATLLKRRLKHRCFPVNFARFLRTSFFIEHLWWLLLPISYEVPSPFYGSLMTHLCTLVWSDEVNQFTWAIIQIFHL